MPGVSSATIAAVCLTMCHRPGVAGKACDTGTQAWPKHALRVGERDGALPCR